MKTDREIVGTLLGFDDFVSILSFFVFFNSMSSVTNGASIFSMHDLVVYSSEICLADVS